MPKAGQGADKTGNRYEGKWIALQCAAVLEEKASSIQLDPPRSEDEGFEFWLEKPVPEWHQVKRQTAKGSWTLNQLSGVLEDFWEKLEGSDAECHFVSNYQAHELLELSDRARSATTYKDFEEAFLDSQTWKKHFSDLRVILKNPPAENVFFALKRVRVRVMDEQNLEETVSSRLAPLVDSPDPDTIRDVLIQYVLENVHKRVTAQNIWNHLRSRNFLPRQWNNSPFIREKIGAQNFRYSQSIDLNLPDIGDITRAETQHVLEVILADEQKQHALITGAAGGGKSSVVQQLIRELDNRIVPYLALRVDGLERVSTAKSIGAQLELPDSPAYVLGGYAKDRTSVLIIDQLDAVSLASGRNSEFFHCIAELINQAKSFPHLRLVLVCRAYDMRHDARFQSLVKQTQTKEISVELLTREQLGVALQKLGVDAARLSPRQLHLFSLPLHLKLLSDLRQTEAFKTLSFTTTKSLFDAFWDHKHARVEERLGRETKWLEVLDAVVNTMSQTQTLHVPRSYLDDYGRDVKAMTSEQILSFDGSRYSFFHEGFFDYVFARRFVSKHNLVGFLEKDVQHLFRRAQVRQVLQHRRDADFTTYLTEVRCLIEHPSIRYHLKQVVYSFLGALPDPRLEEWQLLEPSLNNPQEALYNDVLSAIQYSPSWFDLLYQHGLLQAWLSSETQRTLAFALINGSVAFRQDVVAELLEPCLEQLETWAEDFIITSRVAGLNGEGKLSALFLKMIDRGLFDNRPFWYHVLHHDKNSAPFAVTAIGSYLARALKRARELGEDHPFSEEHNLIDAGVAGEGGLVTLAESAPEVFVREIFPIVVQLAKVHKDIEFDGIYSSSIWRYYLSYTSDAAEVILTALKRAIKKVAEVTPEQLEVYAQQLESIPVDTAQDLLVEIFTAAPEYFAAHAYHYFTTHPSGLDSDLHGEYSWGARSVMEVAFPYWTGEQMRDIEHVILGHWPARDTWHRSEKRTKLEYPLTRIGWSQLVLLDGLPSSRLSATGLKRLHEWRRKFGHEKEPLPRPRFRGGIAQTVGAPRPGRAQTKMTDAQWLEAMKKYDRENIEWVNHHPIGGASQLAFVFRQQVKLDPQRFIKFTELFPSNIHRSYVDALLWGIMDTPVTLQMAMPLLEWCHVQPGKPFGSALCRFVETRAGETLPDTLLDMVGWYARHDANPDADRLDDKQVDHGFTSVGINSVRGRAAETIMHLIWDKPERMTYLLPTIEGVLGDACLSVRVCVAEILLAMLRHDRKVAVDYFLKLAEVEDDRFFCARSVDEFLHYALYDFGAQLKPIVARLAGSRDSVVATYGTRRLALAELGEATETPIFVNRHRASDAQRVAIAQIFAANVTQGEYRARCEAGLKEFLYDPNEAVSEAAANCFQHIALDDLPKYKELIDVYIESPAFKKGHDHLLYALERSSAIMPTIILKACHQWLDRIPESEKSLGYPSFVDDLAFRAYTQSLHVKDTILQGECLDLIDKVVASKRFRLNSAFEQFERG